jgi:lipopolysaccharide export LptBFGC system permease protein LptF
MPIEELLQTIQQKMSQNEDHKRELVEWHRRLALPFANIVFGLIAIPLSTRPLWSLRSSGFAVSLGVILLYYLLLTVGEALGKKGGLPPIIALWLPNIVLGSVGIFLFLRTAKESTFSR